MATLTSTSTANSSGTSSSSVSREGSAKTVAADQISQAIQSTSNLLHLMLQSSPAQVEPSPINEASKKPFGEDIYNNKHRVGIRTDASGNFFNRCTRG